MNLEEEKKDERRSGVVVRGPHLASPEISRALQSEG